MDHVRATFGINENKIVATITDNGSNFVKAFAEYGIKISDALECLEEEDKDDETEDNEGEDMDIIMQVSLPEDEVISDDIVLSTHLRCCSHTLSLICTTDASKATNLKIHHSINSLNEQLKHYISRDQ